jgi:hypothetical protein
MDGIPVNLDDIDALAQTLDPGSAKDLLGSLAIAIREVSRDDESVTVTVTVTVEVVESLQETFDAAFEPGAPASRKVANFSLNKIGRL